MDLSNPDSPAAAAAISRPPRVWRFWGTALWGLFIFAAMFIGQVAPMLAIVIWKAGKIDLAEAVNVAGDGRALALTVISGLPAVLAAIWLPVHLSRTPFKEYLALRWTTWQNVVIGIAAMIVVVEGWDLLSKATGHEVTAGFMGDILKSATADGVLWLAVLAFAVVAPLTEELLARGFLYRGWSESFLRVPARSSCRRWSGPRCTCNTICFSSARFFDRIVLGYIRYRSQSIWLTTLLHGLNNLAALIQTIVMTHS